MQVVNLSFILIFSTISTIFFAFLFMDAVLFFSFLLFSSLLMHIDRNFIAGIVKNNQDIIYLILPTAISFPFIVFKNYSTIFYFIVSIYCLLLSCSLYKRIFDVYVSFKYLFYIFSGYTMIYLYNTYGMYRLGYQLEYMLGDHISSNGVTTFTGMLCFMYVVIKFRLFGKTSFLPCFINLYISYEGYSRGSIIFAIMLIVINFIFLFFKLNTHQRIFTLLLVGISIVFFTPYIYEAYLNTKFANSGFDTPRIEMFRQYMNALDAYSLFFGASYKGTIIEDFNSNPHIAYIRAHHILGLFYLLLIFLVILTSFMKVVKNKDKVGMVIFIAIVALLLRCVSEPLLFPTLFDTFFFLSLYLCCSKNLSTQRC